MATAKRNAWRGTPLSGKQQEEISRAVLIEGKTYQEVADKYGRSRERIRQIVKKLNPHFSRVGFAKYGYCVRCGKARAKPLSPQKRYKDFPSNANDYCQTCRAILYKQPIELACENCKETIHVGIGWVSTRLRDTKRRKGRSFLRFDKDKLKGSYLCQPCFYKLMRPLNIVRRKYESPRVVTRCVGWGKVRTTRLAAIQSRRMRYYPKKHLVLVRCRDCFRCRNKEVDISLLTQKSHS